MTGKRIRTLEGLMLAAHRKKAVVVQPFRIRMPAAFVIGMPARVVHLYFQQGMYVYEKEKKS